MTKSLSRRDLAVRFAARRAARSGRRAASVKAAEVAIQDLTETILGWFLGGGESVTLFGFGTFHLSRRKAFVTTNRYTGQSVSVPATANLIFRQSRETKSRLNTRSVL